MNGGTRMVKENAKPDGNCAFNSMALAMKGLVDDGVYSPEDLAAKLNMNPQNIANLNDSANVQQILSGRLRHAAVSVLRSEKGYRDQLKIECRDLLQDALKVKLGINPNMQPQSALADGAGNPLRDEIKRIVESSNLINAFPASNNDENSIEKFVESVSDEKIEQMLDKYLDYMSQSGTFATQLELQALANHLGVQLRIFRPDGRGGIYGVDEPFDNESVKKKNELPIKVGVVYNGINHFDAVRGDQGFNLNTAT